MLGTERAALVRRLTIVGWLFLGGSVGLIAFQLERVRSITGIAIAMFMIGAISIISILLRDNAGPSEIDGIFLRIGGMSLAVGIGYLCGTPMKGRP